MDAKSVRVHRRTCRCVLLRLLIGSLRPAWGAGPGDAHLDPPPEANDLLVLRPLPAVAAALRSRQDRIIELWIRAVDRHLPHADPLTITQVRNSIPNVVDKIALALESGGPEAVTVLTEVGTAHGVARFQQHYDIEEVIIEYRLLRRIIFDELWNAIGNKL